MLRKIISGGQTGADRAGLDFAIEKGLEHGGYVPRGRKAEDGRIDDRYKPSVSIASSRRSIVRTCRRRSSPAAFRQTTSTRTFMAATSSTVPTHSNARWPLSG